MGKKIKLNGKRQGEGGTLALADVNNTMRYLVWQGFKAKSYLKKSEVPRAGIEPTSKP